MIVVLHGDLGALEMTLRLKNDVGFPLSPSIQQLRQFGVLCFQFLLLHRGEGGLASVVNFHGFSRRSHLN